MKASTPSTPANRAAAAASLDQMVLALAAATGLRLANIAKLRLGPALIMGRTATAAAIRIPSRPASPSRRCAAFGDDPATAPPPCGRGEPPVRQAKRRRRTTGRQKPAKSLHSRKPQKNSKTPRDPR
jgi:hypothetical protein